MADLRRVHVRALGYDKSGLGKRIALLLVRGMGRRTLTLGYAVAIADVLLAPFTPSNTASSGGTIYPVIRNLPGLYDSKPNDPPVMLAVGASIPGINMPEFALLLCLTLGIMGILTPFATGPSPVYYGSGYLSSKDYWWLGAVFGVLFIATMLVIAVPWLKVVG